MTRTLHFTLPCLAALALICTAGGNTVSAEQPVRGGDRNFKFSDNNNPMPQGQKTTGKLKQKTDGTKAEGDAFIAQVRPKIMQKPDY